MSKIVRSLCTAGVLLLLAACAETGPLPPPPIPQMPPPLQPYALPSAEMLPPAPIGHYVRHRYRHYRHYARRHYVRRRHYRRVCHCVWVPVGPNQSP